ncbi:stAR-related lipid transfer protein 3 isoform X2 [Sphaerodactylus townsendi]|uniref:stAR-related lipid transfer protein 3 isoform X2 n=1 Tax=Sphaerodactylus townsendi TaxID=933632 RepID=UPI002025BB3D|nr:stAR-related lipid transfer protein 3 isoform X2 [Sphaerodactylus townsendi]
MSKPWGLPNGDLEQSLPAIASSLSYSQGFSPHHYFSPERRRIISDVRRTFCLFVTFDLLFISLLWIIELNTSKGIQYNLKEEIINYNYKSSFFDIFLLAVFRFSLLLLGYAILRLRHWWIIAVSTLVSSAFLIVKVILSDLLAKGAFGYLLPIVSFVLAWLETWFLDFKVLPQEAEEEQWYLAAQAAVARGPLLYSGALSDGQFYSPPESAAGSDDSDDELLGKRALTDEGALVKGSNELLKLSESDPHLVESEQSPDWQRSTGSFVSFAHVICITCYLILLCWGLNLEPSDVLSPIHGVLLPCNQKEDLKKKWDFFCGSPFLCNRKSARPGVCNLWQGLMGFVVHEHLESRRLQTPVLVWRSDGLRSLGIHPLGHCSALSFASLSEQYCGFRCCLAISPALWELSGC